MSPELGSSPIRNGQGVVATGEMSGSVILPPPDIRSIIDKTAIFVVKNGKEFEQRIYQQERHNPKFCFLALHDPYHGYYELRLQELIEGGQAAIKRIQEEMQQNQQQADSQQHVGYGSRVQAESLESGPPPPPSLPFTLDIPTISPLDLDIIKLTAQYVARNGQQFLANLARKEAGNVQFDFLRPGHSLYKLFLRLVDQYALVMLPNPTVSERITRCKDKYGLLEHIMKERVEHARWQAAHEQRMQADQARDMEEYNRVNWNEFVVVETIDFTPSDKQVNLPAALDFVAVGAMSLLQRQELWSTGLLPAQQAEKRAAALAADEAAEMEIDTGASKKIAVTGQSGHPEHVNVRTDYRPKAAAARVGQEQMITCNICSQQIPSSQFDEHRRIELLDSKWAEQRKAHLAKHTDTNIVESGTDVSRNLAAMAKQRSVSDRQAILAQKVVWDGTQDSMAGANREAMIKSKEQMQREVAELERRGGDLSLDPHTGIGPRVPVAGAYPYPYPPQGYPQPPPSYPPQMPPPGGYPMMPGYYPPPGQPMYPGGYPYPPPPPGYPPQQQMYPPPGYPPQQPPPPGHPMPPPGYPYQQQQQPPPQ